MANKSQVQTYGTLIGRGVTGKVFEVDKDTVVKVYPSPSCSFQDNIDEHSNATKITTLMDEGVLSRRYARLLKVSKNPRTGMYDFYMERYHSDLERELGRSNQPNQQGKVVEWIGQALLAIIELHQTTNYIHDDFNPKNVFITKEGAAHLGDWQSLKLGTVAEQGNEIYYFAIHLLDEAYGRCDSEPKEWLCDLLAPIKHPFKDCITENWSHDTLVQFVKLFVRSVPQSDALAKSFSS